MVQYLMDNNGENVDYFIVDNGSDIKPPAFWTSIKLPKNRQTMGGWLAGWDLARWDSKYDAYIFAITSTEIPQGQGDIIQPMLDTMFGEERVVGVHPILTPDSTTAWSHMKRPGDAWMIDNIFAMYRADWFDMKGGFDPDFRYGWGPDLEMGYLARKDIFRLVVTDKCTVKKVTNIGYDMDRMNMTASEREIQARRNMHRVMERKYGNAWKKIMRPDLP
jgi:hypothetical protein